MSTLTVLHLMAATACWLALAGRIRSALAHPDERIRRYICVALAGLAMALTLGLPTVYTLTDALLGVANAAKLLQHVSVVATGYAVTVVFAHLTEATTPHRGQAQGRAALAVAAIMVVLFGAAPVDSSEPIYFADRYADVPLVSMYLATFLAYLGYVGSEIARTSGRFARELAGATRASMVLFAVAGWVALAYVAIKIGYIAARLGDVDVPIREGALSSPPALAVGLLAGAGVALPRAQRTLARLRRWPSLHRNHRRLYPLWRDLNAAVPGIALDRQPRRDLWRPTSVEYRLYRRVIEVRDGMLAVLPYAPSGLAFEVHADATAEATALAAALNALREGAPPGPVASVSHHDSGGTDGTDGTDDIGDLASEVAWLVRVADAYAAHSVAGP